ncbi:MAG TPA: class I SAM-dependent methyltransferase [Candidatus Dormibacteraeota bacterium]
MTEVRAAYERAGDAWSRGPSRLYDQLALRIVESAGEQLRGTLVLDAGAGTGAVCRALRSAGATAIALDAAAGMLAHIGNAALLSVVGDICAQPFLAASFDAAVSAFTISHLEAPERALGEMRRVVRARGLVVAAVFGAAAPNASKDVVDQVAAEHGFVAPAWYVTLKACTEPLTNTPERLRACAEAAGLQSVSVADVTVDPGLDSPEAMVEYRLGMAHVAAFVSSLEADERESLVRDATAAVARRGQAIRPRVLILSSRASE